MLYSYIHIKLNVKLYFTIKVNKPLVGSYRLHYGSLGVHGGYIVFKLQYIVGVGDLGFDCGTVGVGDLANSVPHLRCLADKLLKSSYFRSFFLSRSS